MVAEQSTDKQDRSYKNRKKPLLISLGILVAGGVITTIILLTEPKAVREGATKETAMLVNVITVKRDTFSPTIEAMGTVEPSQDITLSPQVSGEIIKLSESFTPGAFVEKGKTLLQIEPSDYENRLQTEESNLRQAVADLKIEMGRQNIAEKDYQLLDEELSHAQESLILRKPQLNAARSKVEAARAAVKQAKLDLQRTTIEAPFDAHVIRRNVNAGSQVSPGQDLGRLVGMDTYWVETTVPLNNLRWLAFPEDEASMGSKVRIHNSTAWETGEYRTGRLYKLIGALDDNTRMARVLVSVPDPLGYRTDTADVPTLVIGSLVEAHIQAKNIPDVIRLNRDYVRKNETVWVMQNNTLRIHDVKVVFRDSKYAYISNGLSETDTVVTTNLTTVADGARLRSESTAKSGKREQENTSQQEQNNN